VIATTVAPVDSLAEEDYAGCVKSAAMAARVVGGWLPRRYGGNDSEAATSSPEEGPKSRMAPLTTILRFRDGGASQRQPSRERVL